MTNRTMEQAQALQALCPGAQWYSTGDTYADIVWVDEAVTKPTEAEYDAAVARLGEPQVPTSVTPRQARLALLAAGLLDQVQAAVDAAGGATKITWEFATTIERNSPLIDTLGTSLGLTSDQIDVLFKYASTQ